MMKHKIVTIVSAGFLGGFSLNAFSQSAIKDGVWEIENGSPCPETFTFLSNKELLHESGEQTATRAYKLVPYRRTGFYTFSQKTTSHNEQPNCSGKIGMKVGSSFKVFIRVNDISDEMTFYSSPNQKDILTKVIARKRKVAPPQDGEEEVIFDTPMEF